MIRIMMVSGIYRIIETLILLQIHNSMIFLAFVYVTNSKWFGVQVFVMRQPPYHHSTYFSCCFVHLIRFISFRKTDNMRYTVHNMLRTCYDMHHSVMYFYFIFVRLLCKNIFVFRCHRLCVPLFRMRDTVRILESNMLHGSCAAWIIKSLTTNPRRRMMKKERKTKHFISFSVTTKTLA